MPFQKRPPAGYLNILRVKNVELLHSLWKKLQVKQEKLTCQNQLIP